MHPTVKQLHEDLALADKHRRIKVKSDLDAALDAGIAQYEQELDRKLGRFSRNPKSGLYLPE